MSHIEAPVELPRSSRASSSRASSPATSVTSTESSVSSSNSRASSSRRTAAPPAETIPLAGGSDVFRPVELPRSSGSSNSSRASSPASSSRSSRASSSRRAAAPAEVSDRSGDYDTSGPVALPGSTMEVIAPPGPRRALSPSPSSSAPSTVTSSCSRGTSVVSNRDQPASQWRMPPTSSSSAAAAAAAGAETVAGGAAESPSSGLRFFHDTDDEILGTDPAPAAAQSSSPRQPRRAPSRHHDRQHHHRPEEESINWTLQQQQQQQQHRQQQQTAQAPIEPSPLPLTRGRAYVAVQEEEEEDVDPEDSPQRSPNRSSARKKRRNETVVLPRASNRENSSFMTDAGIGICFTLAFCIFFGLVIFPPKLLFVRFIPLVTAKDEPEMAKIQAWHFTFTPFLIPLFATHTIVLPPKKEGGRIQPLQIQIWSRNVLDNQTTPCTYAALCLRGSSWGNLRSGQLGADRDVAIWELPSDPTRDSQARALVDLFQEALGGAPVSVKRETVPDEVLFWCCSVQNSGSKSLVFLPNNLAEVMMSFC